MKLRIKSGDQVKVIAGKDKGKTGKVLQVFPRLNRVSMFGAINGSLSIALCFCRNAQCRGS